LAGYEQTILSLTILTKQKAYGITKQNLAQMQQPLVPDAVRSKLAALENQVFSDTAAFSEALVKAIGQEQAT
jgi:hypothetical protein